MPSYLVIPGIQGDSVARSFEGAIEVTSWTFGCSQPSGGGMGSGARSGRPQFTAAAFGCRGGSASPQLLELCAMGRRISDAVLTQQTGDAGATTEARFSDVRVLAYTASGGEDDRRDDLQLGFGSVTFTVRTQMPDGRLADPVVTTQPPGGPPPEPPPAPTPGSGGIWRPRGPVLPPG